MVFSSGVQTCVIAGCDEKAISRGMCRTHYDRWRYTGSPVKPVRARVCITCGRVFELRSMSKKFCSDACRKRFKRNSEQSRYSVDDSPNPIISRSVRNVRSLLEWSLTSFRRLMCGMAVMVRVSRAASLFLVML